MATSQFSPSHSLPPSPPLLILIPSPPLLPSSFSFPSPSPSFSPFLLLQHVLLLPSDRWVIRTSRRESPLWSTVQPVRKTTWVGRPSRLYDHYGWQPWFFTLYLTWVERPATDLFDATTTTSFHRPKVFFTLYWTCLSDHHMSTFFGEWELSYPACLIWIFSPW